MKKPMYSIAQTRQLRQLYRHDRKLFYFALQGIISVPEAIHRLAAKLRGEPATLSKAELWATIEDVARGNFSDLKQPGDKREIGEIEAGPVFLYRRRDEMICLYLPAKCETSGPIIRWGRDWENLSSAYAGRYKIDPNARWNFENWWERCI